MLVYVIIGIALLVGGYFAGKADGRKEARQQADTQELFKELRRLQSVERKYKRLKRK